MFPMHKIGPNKLIASVSASQFFRYVPPSKKSTASLRKSSLTTPNSIDSPPISIWRYPDHLCQHQRLMAMQDTIIVKMTKTDIIITRLSLPRFCVLEVRLASSSDHELSTLSPLSATKPSPLTPSPFSIVIDAVDCAGFRLNVSAGIAVGYTLGKSVGREVGERVGCSEASTVGIV